MSVFRDDILSGQVAIVTGGATGIGFEIARTLGRHGARVCICSRKAESLERAVGELGGDGVDAFHVVCDVRDVGQVRSMLDAVLERWTRIDVLVNHAAGNFPAPLSRISPNGFRTIVDIDLLGTYNCSKLAYEAWLRDHGGNIVNISAPFEGKGAALSGPRRRGEGGRRLAHAHLRRRVGPPRHPRERRDARAHRRHRGDGSIRRGRGGERGGSTVPLGREGTRADMANAVLFLVSDAASYVSGQVFAVDGASTVDQLGMAPTARRHGGGLARALMPAPRPSRTP